MLNFGGVASYCEPYSLPTDSAVFQLGEVPQTDMSHGQNTRRSI